MNRTVTNLVVDLTAAALFLGMAATGYILWFALPPGTNRALSLWGLSRHQWGNVHAWLSFALLGTIFLHVWLHWQWLVSTIRKRLGLTNATPGNLVRSGAATILAVAVVLGVFGWAAQVGVREITEPRDGACPPNEVKESHKVVSSEASTQRTTATALPTPGPRWEEVYPILEKSCLSCHGPKKARGGFRVDRRADWFGANGQAALVIPGNSSASPIIAIVTGQRDIPPSNAHRLPEDAVKILRAWIDAGASWPAP